MTSDSINRVLLIECDRLVREGMRALLRAWNFDVVAGSEPRVALQAAAGTPAPDFAIIAAPGGDRVVAAAWIEELDAHYADLPIILVADRSDQVANTAVRERFVRIDWPVTPDGLRDAIVLVMQPNAAL